MRIEEKARGKINLTLEVLGLRPDGYHEIKSVMQTVELHDVLTFEEARELTLTGSDSRLRYDGSNLVLKAAEALRQAAGTRKGAAIHLEKRIPIEAGMAGGSTDAAAALRGLNRLWKLNLPVEQLMEIGAGIGSDIPFCLVGGTAMVEGRGERVRSIRGPEPAQVLVVKPDFGASTALVYKGFDDLTEVRFQDRSGAMEEALAADRDFRGLLYNDLERVTTELYPEVREILNEMGEETPYRLMSGSGPTCLCFGENGSINRLYESFRKRYREVHRTRLI